MHVPLNLGGLYDPLRAKPASRDFGMVQDQRHVVCSEYIVEERMYWQTCVSGGCEERTQQCLSGLSAQSSLHFAQGSGHGLRMNALYVCTKERLRTPAGSLSGNGFPSRYLPHLA